MMSCKIKLMSDHLINQIAAGEVVENPASVVKELVENALDADASEIFIEIKQGGRALIKVSDNGFGMNREECQMAMKRHATSKMRALTDFDALFTMGFRGEALPSIASVSRFSMLSAPREGKEATFLALEGEGELQVSSSTRDGGTTIEVRDLFFNVPVRRKFQKSPAYDAAEVYRVLEALALAHLSVGFTFIRDGETLFRLFPEKGAREEQLLQRIRQLLGDSFTERLRPVEKRTEGMEVWGFIGEPTETRPNRLGQYLFLNRRTVVSPLVSEAVREGYGTTIAPMRFPLFVLHLELDPKIVDVNVHPQKKEVRLESGEKLSGFLQSAVHEGLRRIEKPLFAFQTRPLFESIQLRDEPLIPKKAAKEVAFTPPLPEELSIAPPRGELIGLLKGYIVAVAPDKRILFLHQRRLHERLLFEGLRGTLKRPPRELYLIPEVIKLTPSEAEALEHHLPELREVGFELSRLSVDSFTLEAAPVRFENKEIALMMRSMVELLEREGSDALRKQLSEKLMKRVAREGAVSMERRLSLHEAEEMIEAFFSGSVPETSLSGEPLYKEIERF